MDKLLTTTHDGLTTSTFSSRNKVKSNTYIIFHHQEAALLLKSIAFGGPMITSSGQGMCKSKLKELTVDKSVAVSSVVTSD